MSRLPRRATAARRHPRTFSYWNSFAYFWVMGSLKVERSSTRRIPRSVLDRHGHFQRAAVVVEPTRFVVDRQEHRTTDLVIDDHEATAAGHRDGPISNPGCAPSDWAQGPSRPGQTKCLDRRPSMD